MTDKELLELAAKAAGIKLKWMIQLGNGVKADEDFISNWHPLTDDGDALRLAVKLKMELVLLKDTIVPSRAVAWKDGTAQCCLWEPENDDSYAATRRAIVRAAAEIGKTL